MGEVFQKGLIACKNAVRPKMENLNIGATSTDTFHLVNANIDSLTDAAPIKNTIIFKSGLLCSHSPKHGLIGEGPEFQVLPQIRKA